MILLILYLISVIGCFITLSYLEYNDRGVLTVGMLLFLLVSSTVPVLNSCMSIVVIVVELVNYLRDKYNLDDFFSKVVIGKKD